MAEPRLPDPIGGHPALDLVNTVSWRADPERVVDRLASFAVLLTWLRRTDLIDPSATPRLRSAAGQAPAPAAAALAAAKRLREALHRVLLAHVASAAPAARDLRAIHTATIDARRHATARETLPLRWVLTPQTPAAVPRLLALTVEDLLVSATRLAVTRRCHGTGCGWFFLDSSRNHSRRWCSVTDCGNRERARRHYSRIRHPARPPGK